VSKGSYATQASPVIVKSSAAATSGRKEPCGRVNPASLQHIRDRTGITLLHVPKPEDAEAHFQALGLPGPPWENLPEIWRYSFWAQRRLLKCLSLAIHLPLLHLGSPSRTAHRLPVALERRGCAWIIGGKWVGWWGGLSRPARSWSRFPPSSFPTPLLAVPVVPLDGTGLTVEIRRN